MKLNFSNDSINITKNLTDKEIKDNGIYFTPQSIIKKTYDILLQYIDLTDKNILEPSCGSMEFINYLLNNNIKYKNITCIENNIKIYNVIKTKSTDTIKIFNNDFLNAPFGAGKWDLIIGNPPYVIINKKQLNNYKSFNKQKYFEGRPNLFILFIIKSLELLEVNGILCFILPISFMNCLYYNILRNHIYNNYTIIDIIICNNDIFLNTKQDTFIFIIKNTKDLSNINDNFILNINNCISFNTKDNIVKLNNILNNKYDTLYNLKCNLSIGTVVWNQVKNILTDNNENTRLIYNSDIIDNKLSIVNYKNKEKKNYIIKKGTKDKIIVLNRGYGTGKYKLNYCLINVDFEYLIENHLICIKCPNDSLFDIIIASFDNPKTNEFIDIYFGNAAINIAELNHIIPIFI
jgi:hypothetical protein